MKRLLVIALVLCLAPAATADSLTVKGIAFGTGIESHAVTGVDTAFDINVGRIYCWTSASGAGVGDTIYHTWTLGDQEVQTIPLHVEGARYRTHSYKTLHKGMAGVWTVEVTDQAGNVLATESVNVTGEIAETP